MSIVLKEEWTNYVKNCNFSEFLPYFLRKNEIIANKNFKRSVQMKQIITKFIVVLLSLTIIPLGVVCKATITNLDTDKFILFDISSKKTISMTPKEYLVGALFAEIDPSYNLEVLKAQALVCYNNALLMKLTSEAEYDFEIDISQEILYIDEKTAKEKYADEYKNLLDKIETAIDSVYNKCITYGSKTVLLPYFASSNGFTEDAKTVWGQDVNYLKPVESPGDLLNPNAKTTFNFSVQSVRDIVKEQYDVELPDDATNCFYVESRTNSGTVSACSLGSIVMTGQNLRSLLGLCSANFDLSCDGETLTVTCYGEGHCVGMSQYGADFMARQGSSYIEILKHYYTGIEIT